MNSALSEELLSGLPSLKQKFLVDLVNGIDVNRDHIRLQKSRDGFVSRLWDAYTGEGHRRQSQINDNVIEGLDSCLTWLNSLTEQLTFTNNALVQVNQGLMRVKTDLAQVAHFAADTQEQLDALEHNVSRHFHELEQQIQDLDMRQRAFQQMDTLFNSWGAGNYAALSIAQRGFLVVSELAWGVFGDYCQRASIDDREQILLDLRNRLIVRMAQDANVTHESRIDANVWVQCLDLSHNPGGLGGQYQQAVAYLGNGINDQHPFTRFVLEPGRERPLVVPFLMTAPRLVKGMSNDLLKDGYLYVN